MKRGTMSKLYKCTICNKNKQPFEFYANKKNSNGLDCCCKECRKEKSRIRYAEKNEEVKQQQKVYWDSVKDSINEKKVEARANNLEFFRERDKQYYRRDLEHSRLRSVIKNGRRRAKKLNACPTWLSETDLAKIKSIYKNCKNISKKTGTIHHVDHIVPLQGENVCGLHVPWNLRVIPASVNCSKSNKLVEDIVYSL
jgi:molecular chaperone DnaK (HSP70)